MIKGGGGDGGIVAVEVFSDNMQLAEKRSIAALKRSRGHTNASLHALRRYLSCNDALHSA